MVKESFCKGWSVCRVGDEKHTKLVDLPHDAMLEEERTAQSAGGTNTGWFAAHDYRYEKRFTVPEEWRTEEIWIEFEGIYHNAELWVNGVSIPACPNGYIGFQRKLNDVLIFGGENVVKVIAHNADQPNSRWYSGAGLYRPVWLCRYPKRHILPEQVVIRTLDWQEPRVQVSFAQTEPGMVKAEIMDGTTVLAVQETEGSSLTFSLPGAALWSVERPKRYTCRLTCGTDVQEIPFGIRVVTCDAEHGFCINGARVLLLGACIHHDNGILGAVAYPTAERRKIKLLRQAGYNAIRCAHNPCSKALLEACDELGMLVLDEYVDMWYIHKTQYDYANYFEANWKKDLEAMVQKDRNHPSVVMYSIGNEVSETAQKRGIELTEEMVRYLHGLDERPVTCGINIFFNFLSSLGFGVYSDDKAKQEAAKAGQKQGKQKKKAVGSEFINNVAGLLGAGFMKFGATLHGSDVKTRDAFAKLDVAGYNYGVDRYKKDLKKYPNRVILGSETFCSDAATFYDLAQDHPALIGDFVWTGMDYLGEVGLGSWEYAAYAPTFEHEPGWITAGAGTLDLIGAETCQAAYTQVAFGLSPVRIGVIPVKFAGEKHSPAAWRMTNAVESWSWGGCNGMETTVEVYARGAEVALELNGTTLGKKKLPASGRVSFSAVYQPGTLTAVVYDEGGKEIARASLQTAQQETQLTLCPEEPEVKADELCYVRLHYTDGAGTIKPLARGEITLQVEGAKLLAFGNACSYNQRGYLTDTSDTYYGQALAVLQPLGEGTITLQAQSPYGAASACIPCTAAET